MLTQFAAAAGTGADDRAFFLLPDVVGRWTPYGRVAAERVPSVSYISYEDPRIASEAYRIVVYGYCYSEFPSQEFIDVMDGKLSFGMDVSWKFAHYRDRALDRLRKAGLTVSVDDAGVATVSTGFAYDDAFRSQLASLGLERSRFVSIDKIVREEYALYVRGAHFGATFSTARPSSCYLRKRMFATIIERVVDGVEKRDHISTDGSMVQARIAAESFLKKIADNDRKAREARELMAALQRQESERLAFEEDAEALIAAFEDPA